jgi:hypothetical protein
LALHELGRLGIIGNIFIRNLQMIGISDPCIIVGKPGSWYPERCVGSRAVNSLAALKDQATSLSTVIGCDHDHCFDFFVDFMQP